VPVLVVTLQPVFKENPRPLARNLHKIQNPDWLLTRKQFGSGNQMMRWEDSIQSPLPGVHCGMGKWITGVNVHDFAQNSQRPSPKMCHLRLFHVDRRHILCQQ
jgi:hypothetical protein